MAVFVSLSDIFHPSSTSPCVCGGIQQDTSTQIQFNILSSLQYIVYDFVHLVYGAEGQRTLYYIRTVSTLNASRKTNYRLYSEVEMTFKFTGESSGLLGINFTFNEQEVDIYV